MFKLSSNNNIFNFPQNFYFPFSLKKLLKKGIWGKIFKKLKKNFINWQIFEKKKFFLIKKKILGKITQRENFFFSQKIFFPKNWFILGFLFLFVKNFYRKRKALPCFSQKI